MITKVDLVGEARVAEVEEDVQILTLGTSLQDSPTVRFSFVTGQGLEELRAKIVQTLRSRTKPAPPGYFRMPVDRVFSLPGHGLVVTGTAQAGAIGVGDRVRCLPAEQLFRVRSLQVHGEPVATATWGQRVALNLTGPDRPDIARGHVVSHELLTTCSSRFDAVLQVRRSAGAGIKNHQRVRIHLGTAERMAKLILLPPRSIARPEGETYCQAVLDEPLMTLRGDHFIVRGETAQRTLGGGIVVHPWPPVHSKREVGLETTLKTLHRGRLEEVAELLLSKSDDFALPIGPIHQFLNRELAEVRELLDRIDGIKAVSQDGEQVYTSEGKWRALQAALLAALKDYHVSHRLAAGRDMEELHDKLSKRVPARLFRAFVDELERLRVIAREGSVLRLPEHAVTLGDDEKRHVERILNLLKASPLAPPDLTQLEQETRLGRAQLTEVLRVLERQQLVVRVGASLYFLRETIEAMKRSLHDEFLTERDITPAMFRDRFGTTRKYAIPLLEYLDREGVTVRVGETRRLKEKLKI